MGFASVTLPPSKPLVQDAIVKALANAGDVEKLEREWIFTPSDVALLSPSDWEKLSLSREGEVALKSMVAWSAPPCAQTKDNQQQLLGTILNTLQQLIQALTVKLDPEAAPNGTAGKSLNPKAEPRSDNACDPYIRLGFRLLPAEWHEKSDVVEAKRTLSRSRNKVLNSNDFDKLEIYILRAIYLTDVASLKYFFFLWDQNVHKPLTCCFYDDVARYALYSCHRPTILFVKENIIDAPRTFERAFQTIKMKKLRHVFDLGPIIKNDLFFKKHTFDLYLEFVSQVTLKKQ